LGDAEAESLAGLVVAVWDCSGRRHLDAPWHTCLHLSTLTNTWDELFTMNLIYAWATTAFPSLWGCMGYFWGIYM
jgi:hypothetical protein